jgi:hypothetical protein
LAIAPSILSHDQSSFFSSSNTSKPLFHSFSKTPAARHSWKRRWAVELEQIPVAFKAFH